MVVHVTLAGSPLRSATYTIRYLSTGHRAARASANCGAGTCTLNLSPSSKPPPDPPKKPRQGAGKRGE
eukprot:2222560-Rhodomonas_salina.1